MAASRIEADSSSTSYTDSGMVRLSMPEPMVALPWGSRSIMSTRWPIRARPAARLTVVVVLPTPPFWLATQKIFAMPTALLGLFGDRQLDAETDQEDPRQPFQRLPDARVGAHALGQEMGQRHGGQAVQEGEEGDGGGHGAEGDQPLVLLRIDKQREEGHVEDDGLGVEQGDGQ